MQKYDPKIKLSLTELEQAFKELNKAKKVNVMDRLYFCWYAMASDADKNLELVLYFIEHGDKALQAELKSHFQFKKDKLKVYTFLKNKLQTITSKIQLKHIEEILEIVNYISLKDYKIWLADLKSGKRNDELGFIWALMKSDHIEYHYSLLKDEELSKEYRRHLGSRFDEHGAKGNELLLSKLDQNIDTNFHGDIIYIIKSGILTKENRAKALNYARALTQSKDDDTRENAIISIGSIGGLRELELLKDRLLNDTNSKCRAWASSSFMQMWFRRKSEKLRLFSLISIQEALKQEKDYFTLSVFIDTLREIENNKFGISQKSIDALDREQIDITIKRIERYLIKKLGK